MDTTSRSDGFADQRLVVVPAPLIAEALTRPITRRMLVTDAGRFPRASRHERRRALGAAETIVIVCTDGAGWIEADGERRRVVAGSATVIPSGMEHAYGADDADPWTIWWCHLRGEDTAELASAIGAAVDPVSLRAPERVTALLDELVTTLECGTTPTHLLEAAGIAWRLLTQLAVDRQRPAAGTPAERAMRYLEDRIDGRISVTELAALVGVSPSHLTALFRSATGGGVLAHHHALKMGRARSLLDTTDLSIAEIARAVGIDDPFYFSRRFRTAHGMSPTSYRALHKG